MDQVQHKFVDVQGLKLHVAEVGTGPNVVVFLHGFPEIWYSWRHQMIALANAGFRAIAPDHRGYGLSDRPPPQLNKASFVDLITDLLTLLDALQISKVFLVAKDFGARPAYLFAILHPKRVLGVITLGVPFMPKCSTFHKYLSEGFYMSRWRELGRAEADCRRLDAKTVIRNIYILFSRSEIPIAAKNQEIMDLVDSSTPLPLWFTEEDLITYGALYEKSGFLTALQIPHRSVGKDFTITDAKVKVPVLLIMGGKDYILKFQGMEDYIKSGNVKKVVPNLEITFLPKGTHFVQEQSPDEVNHLIFTFLGKHV